MDDSSAERADSLDADQRLRELEALTGALKRAKAAHRNRIEDLEAEVDELTQQLGRLQTVVNPDPEKTPFEQMSPEQKAQRLRYKLAEIARHRGGTAMMEYSDVMMEFNYQPSRGHAYDIMRQAGEIRGFAYEERDDRNDRIIVNLDDVTDLSVCHGVTTPIEEEGG